MSRRSASAKTSLGMRPLLHRCPVTAGVYRYRGGGLSANRRRWVVASGKSVSDVSMMSASPAGRNDPGPGWTEVRLADLPDFEQSKSAISVFMMVEGSDGSHVAFPSVHEGEPQRDGPDWNDLRLFRMLAEELSFTRAASRAQVSQPTLSTRIQRLERKLGVVLFDRSTRRMNLTSAGRHLLVGVEIMATELAQTLSGLQAGGDMPPDSSVTGGSVLRLGFYDIGPTRLPKYVKVVPGISRCDLVSLSDAVTALATLSAGGVDFLVSYYFDAESAPAVPVGVMHATVVRERLHVLLPSTHRLAQRDTISILELNDEQWIVRAESALADRQINLLRRHGIEPRITHVTSNMESQRFLVATGQGIDITSPLYIADPGTIIKALREPVDSVFMLYATVAASTLLFESTIQVLRTWYVEGLAARDSTWLAEMRKPDAHPTLKAALAALRQRDE